jgi:hypothetical protein
MVRPPALLLAFQAEFLYSIEDAPHVGGEILLTKETYMADTVKKAKAPAKPRKTAVKKDKVAATPAPVMPSREEIEKLAQRYWAQRGYTDGFAEQDWLRAEQELLQKAS